MRLPILGSAVDEPLAANAAVALCAAVANTAVRHLFYAQTDRRLVSHKILNTSFGTWAGVSLKGEEEILNGIICDAKPTKHVATSVFLPGYDFWDYEKLLRRRAATPLPCFSAANSYGIGTSGLGDVWNRASLNTERHKLSNWNTEKARAAGQAARLLINQKREANMSPQERYAQLRQQRQDMALRKEIQMEKREAQIMKQMKEQREQRQRQREEQEQDLLRVAERVALVQRERAVHKASVRQREYERVQGRRELMDFDARCHRYGCYAEDGKLRERRDAALLAEKQARERHREQCREELRQMDELRKEGTRRSRKEVKVREARRRNQCKAFVTNKREVLCAERQEQRSKRLQREEDMMIARQVQAATRKKDRDQVLVVTKESKEAWTGEKREMILQRKAAASPRSTPPCSPHMRHNTFVYT